jgi:acyl-CoA dehydrogenase
MPGAIQGQEAGRADLADWRRALGANRFDTDPFFQRLLRRHLAAGFADFEPTLRSVAGEAGEALAALIEESSRDEHLPAVRSHDADGRPLEDVTFHPAYHQAGRVFWGSGALVELAEPGHELRCGALVYLLGQHGEGGHACPVACTAGAIKLLQRVGTDDQRARHLPSLLERDYDRRLHAAQFVTEVQGGSDVGVNACLATPEPDRPGWYRITGEKWFCSVADAGLFVVSARPEGAGPGTPGLGLFLVPRKVGGAPNGFRLRRLKWKLGTRSMATGEIELDGALGEAIGSVDDGFRNLVAIVLDTSRVHNAVMACSLLRGVFVEARAFAERRRAFGRPILEYPAVQELLARIKVRTMAALATTFRILETSDRIDTGRGGEDLVAARRIAVMLNKSWTALACTAGARDGIEVLGGNGTIEDFSSLPRLWRDAIVVESWEGTHNTLAAQVLRDFAVRRLHEPWLGELRDGLDELSHPHVVDARERGRTLLAGLTERIDALIAADARTASATMRHVLDRACQLTDWICLAGQWQWELEQGLETETADALELYEMAFLDRKNPEDAPRLVELHRRLAAGL